MRMTRHCLMLFAAALALGGIAAGLAAAYAPEDPLPTLLTLCISGVASTSPGGLWRDWSLSPATLLPLLGLALAYGARSAGAPDPRRGRDAVLFACGWLLLFVALASPLCRFAADLASAHMVQHLILVALAPPLLVLANGRAPETPLKRLPGLSQLRNPLLAGLLYGSAIWFWHIPRFYQAALLREDVHLLMYGSLIGLSLIFWRSVIGTARAGSRYAAWGGPVCFVTLVHTGMLGALLTFSPRAWYPLMTSGSLRWGLTPLEDQQIAGLIMWVPMGLVYLTAGVCLGWMALGAIGAAGRPEPAQGA